MFYGKESITETLALIRNKTSGVIRIPMPEYKMNERWTDEFRIRDGHVKLEDGSWVTEVIVEEFLGKLEKDINTAMSSGAKLLAGAIKFSSADLSALSAFSTSLKSVLSQMSQISIPPEVKFSMQPVQVNITGAQGLTEAAESIVNGAIKKAFENFISENNLQSTLNPPKQ
jgi:hypothetical protein